jgi:hypothetical protein
MHARPLVREAGELVETDWDTAMDRRPTPTGRGIGEGNLIRVESRRGRLQARARITASSKGPCSPPSTTATSTSAAPSQAERLQPFVAAPQALVVAS